MGHWSYLIGCGPRWDAARRANLVAEGSSAEPDLGPELGAKHQIPLFWLAAFDEGDLLTVRRPYEDGDFLDFVVLWTPTTKALDRLHARRRRVLELIGPSPGDADYYDAWMDLVARRYPEAILLQPEDVLCTLGDDEEGKSLTRALKELADDATGCEGLDALGALAIEPRAGELRPPEDAEMFRRAALTGYSFVVDLDWPPGQEPATTAPQASTAAKPHAPPGSPRSLAPPKPDRYAVKVLVKSGWKFWS